MRIRTCVVFSTWHDFRRAHVSSQWLPTKSRMHEYGLQLKIMAIATILHLLHTSLYVRTICTLRVEFCVLLYLFVNLPHAVCLESRGATSSAYLTKR